MAHENRKRNPAAAVLRHISEHEPRHHRHSSRGPGTLAPEEVCQGSALRVARHIDPRRVHGKVICQMARQGVQERHVVGLQLLGKGTGLLATHGPGALQTVRVDRDEPCRIRNLVGPKPPLEALAVVAGAMKKDEKGVLRPLFQVRRSVEKIQTVVETGVDPDAQLSFSFGFREVVVVYGFGGTLAGRQGGQTEEEEE